ncbi:MAG: protease TldD [Candidatus Bathyarchaeota archaeon BA2]|nr:MAG: protease TldD [Candidatus Bathyarchaeota archaeon BA2]
MAELKPEELTNIGEKAVKIATKKGAEEAEAFLSISSSISVGIERGQIVRSVKGMDRGLGVRALYKKAAGFSYTNILTDKTIQDAAVKAFHSAKASKPDKNWVSLPSPKKHSATKSTYDKRLPAIPPDELVETASVALNAAEGYDKRVFPVGGGVGTLLAARAIINSYGVEAYDKGTSIGCSIETIAREAGEVTPVCFEFNAERVYKIDPEWVGREAARQAIYSLKAKKIKSGNLPIIFTQPAFHALLYYTLINAVKADYVQRERSALKGKIGEKIASDLVTVHDNGLLEGGLQTWKFDGEGAPSQKTLLIEKGVLKHYLYDNYTAKKTGVESTGNAFRGDLAPYASTPVLEATNFTFSPRNKSPENLINEIDDGLIVYGVQGAHSSNPESGEFSVVATPAWKIEKGSVAYAVKGAMLAGTVFDVLKNISALGNNTRKIGHLVAPWIRVENVKIIGRR